MKYNEQLEELQKFRDTIRDIQNIVEGLGIGLGEFIDVIEQKRDDYDARSNLDFDDGEHLTKKSEKDKLYVDKSDDDDLKEQVRKRQVLAGIKP